MRLWRAGLWSGVIATCLLTACSGLGSPSAGGGTTGAPSGSASGSAGRTAMLAPSLPPPSPPPVPMVVGYRLAAAAPAVAKSFVTLAGQFPGVYSGVSVRQVMNGNASMGTLALLALRPELVGNEKIEGKLVSGLVSGISGQGPKVTTKTVAGQEVATAVTKTGNIVAWYRGGLVVLVLGTADLPASLAFTKAYLAAR